MSALNGNGASVKPYDDSKKPAPPDFLINGADGSVTQDGLLYLSGFGCHFQSESLPGALPVGQNNPQRCSYGLYCEQLTGTSFTAPRAVNQHSWLYRIHPTAGHPPPVPVHGKGEKETAANAGEPLASATVVNDFSSPAAVISPAQARWSPFPLPATSSSVDFVQGLHTVCGAGSPALKHGLAMHIYACNTSMVDKSFVNSDGDMLLVPQQGSLSIRTEMGKMLVPVGHIAVVQRGIQWSVAVEGDTRGYVLEVYDGHFRLPELGPIGSNGLANPRDFLHPAAAYEDRECDFTVVHKYSGVFFSYPLSHSPFDVVAWHGNLVPFMYDLNRFVPAGAIRIDHLDPSIFTVLTCPTAEPGTAAADFVIFPPRWAVQETTFRPPWYHRNTMSEFMGNVYGRYEARPDGFLPGGATLHLCMWGHGPDAQTFEKASGTVMPGAHRMPDDSLAFMFETSYQCSLTQYSTALHKPDPNYWRCWEPLRRHFNINDVPDDVRKRRQGRRDAEEDGHQQQQKQQH
jgi:homogentisate 1,2-dioxygenase